MIIVKVASLGGLVKEVAVNETATLEEVLGIADVASEGQEVKVNGRTPCGTLVNGDVITLAPKVKGGIA